MAIVANRHWILLALLGCAVASYSIGFIAGVGVFLVAGALLELAFWFGLFKQIRRR